MIEITFKVENTQKIIRFELSMFITSLFSRTHFLLERNYALWIIIIETIWIRYHLINIYKVIRIVL